MSSEKREHTATPWDWFTHQPGDKKPSRELQMRCLIGADGQGFAHTVGLSRGVDEANAAFIVQACNSFNALVEALEAITKEAQSWHEFHDHEGSPVQCDGICAALPAARAALDLARKGVPR